MDAAVTGLTIFDTVPQTPTPVQSSSEDVQQQLSKIVGALSVIAGLDQRPPAPAPAAPVSPSEIMRLFIQQIRMRRARDRFFPAELFADPAWDMLLDLSIARLDGRRISVSSLCIAAAVPTTTALRWAKVLQDAGMIVRTRDPGDGRRQYVEIADATFDSMVAYARSWR